MPPSDGYAYEALGKLFVDYQTRGEKTYWGQRRVPIQIITLAESEVCFLSDLPFFELCFNSRLV